MTKYSILTGLIFLFSVVYDPVEAADDNYPVGARSASMSHASVMLTDFWSVFHNQAGLVYTENLTLGVSYSNGFLSSLGEQFVGMAVPTGNGSLGTSFSYYGYSEYYEIKGGIAYSMFLTENLSAGVQIDYFNTHMSGFYEDGHLVTFEAGLMYKINSDLKIGFHAFNPFHYQIWNRAADVPSVLRIGAGYQVVSDLLICAEIEKDAEKKLNFKVGLEYLILNKFFVRTGVSTFPFQNSFGIGYNWDRFQIGVSFLKHHTLGYNSGLSINYSF